MSDSGSGGANTTTTGEQQQQQQQNEQPAQQQTVLVKYHLTCYGGYYIFHSVIDTALKVVKVFNVRSDYVSLTSLLLLLLFSYICTTM